MTTTSPELEARLSAVEGRLAALGEALRTQDAAAIDARAADLHRALASAVDQFMLASRSGAVTPALRRRLASAGGQVAAQRESLARATASLDRALDVLMPSPDGTLYGAHGGADRGLRGGVIQA